MACEAATWLNALGAAVTLLVRGDRLLGRFEECASDAVAAGLTDAGVTIRFGVSASHAQRDGQAADREVGRPHGGPVRVTIDGEQVEFDEVLVATGRRPAAGELGLASVGLDADALDGRTRLDDWLYAVGDVTGGPPLTHWGKYQARRVGEAIAAKAAGEDSGRVEPEEGVPVPQVVFTDPQVAQVGVTAAEAADAGREVRVVDEEMSAAAGFGLLRDDASGHARLVIEGDRIVGSTFVGAEVGELLHAATIAIVGRVPLTTLRDAVPAYPTASEIWLRLIESAVWR